MSAGAPPKGEAFVWDDVLWNEVWERNLGPVERHAAAMDVLRRRLPTDLLEARVATELARQWRRHARNLAILYAAWTVFWLLLAWGTWSSRAVVGALPLACALVGVVAVVGALGARRYLKPYSQLYP